jgi:hypothetical protein
MASLQPQQFAVGVIFPYPEAVQESSLRAWFSQRDFQVLGSERGALSLGPEGFQIGGGSFAEKPDDDLEVLFNQHANLEGFSDCSFVTIRTNAEMNTDQVLSEVTEILDEYGEFNIRSEKSVIELTFVGRIRINRSEHVFSNYFDRTDLDSLNEHFDSPVEGAAARFESEAEPSEGGYYKFLLDTGQSKNPNLWTYKLNYRVEHEDSIDVDGLSDTIVSFVDQAKE